MWLSLFSLPEGLLSAWELIALARVVNFSSGVVDSSGRGVNFSIGEADFSGKGIDLTWGQLSLLVKATYLSSYGGVSGKGIDSSRLDESNTLPSGDDSNNSCRGR